MKETVFPDVTTKRDVCAENSIDVIGFGNERLVVSLRVRKSHHLASGEYNVRQMGSWHLLDLAILCSRYTSVVSYPDNTFYHPIMRESSIFHQEIWVGIRPIKIEYPDLLLLTTREDS